MNASRPPGDAVVCAGLALGYGDTSVLSDVDLTVAAGEVLALLGPSGSGKTTLLHAIAGLVRPSAGRIWLAGRLVSGPDRLLPPEQRHVGMVFQNYALWPHMSVLDTVAYPLRRHGVSKVAARQRARELLDSTNLAAVADRRPGQLSGGQAQRVGLARALAAEPMLYLFDEPTAHLDAFLRTALLEEVSRRRAITGAAAVYATHDAAEALAIADTVAVVHDNRLAQVGTPAEVYERPADLAVARLSGPVSVLELPVKPAGPGLVKVQIGDAAAVVECPEVRSSGPATVVARPDWVALGGALPGTVAAVRYRGAHTDYHLATAAGTVLVRESGPPRLAEAAAVTWTLRRIWIVRSSRSGTGR